MLDAEQVNKQKPSSENHTERETRISDTCKLVDGMIGRNKEFFSSPDNRLDFIESQTPEDFFRMAKWANSQLRGEKWQEMRYRDEKGGFLPLLHTPSHEDKPEAFKKGYETIQEYIRSSSDTVEQKVEGVAMASEALIIWTHPFNDGNGRTGRFIGKLIEDGAEDARELVAETIADNARNKTYNTMYPTKESTLAMANNSEVMLDDDERDRMRDEADLLPSNVDGIAMSVKLLLEDKSVRQRTLERAAKYSELASDIKRGIIDDIGNTTKDATTRTGQIEAPDRKI